MHDQPAQYIAQQRPIRLADAGHQLAITRRGRTGVISQD
jgi:hypothetical protein